MKENQVEKRTAIVSEENLKKKKIISIVTSINILRQTDLCLQNSKERRELAKVLNIHF